jgi:hypothetical protein
MKAIVRPAFWFMLSAAQFGPEYAEWFWPRIIDCLIRGGMAFFFACMAVKALRSNSVNHMTSRTGTKPTSPEGAAPV